MRGPLQASMLATLLAVLLPPTNAAAQESRRRFEPTDLRLQGPGAVEVDMQFGVLDGATGVRTVAPDIEATVGLSPNAQLEIDTVFGSSGGPRSGIRFLENTWTSLKLGIFDGRDGSGAWAGGIQAGPRLPTAPNSRGVGSESLVIVGRSSGRFHVFGQAGVLLEPFTDTTRGRTRPFSVEGGLDVDIDLDSHDTWSFRGELGGAHFFELGLDLLQATAGASWNATRSLELSAIGLIGIAGQGDRFGILLGATPRFHLF